MDIDVSSTNTVSTRDKHYATAKVGNDVIENVEYITFDHSGWWTSKKKNVLEKIWDSITTPYYVAKRVISRAYWECRYGFERMFKGYDSVDTFETFYKFTKRYIKILTEFKKYHIGHPCDLSEEEWGNVLDEMIYHLRYMDEETVINELEKDVPDDWSVSTITVYEVMDKHKNAFFELLTEYFYNLWD